MYVYDVVQHDVNTGYVMDIAQAFGFPNDTPITDLGDVEGSKMMARFEDPCDPNSDVHVLEVFKDSGFYYYDSVSKLWDVDPCDANVSLPSET